MIDYLPYIFFGVALFYSSVGFGGGSSYLAILSLVLTDFFEIRSLVLILNVTVVSIGTLMYIKNKVFDIKKFWPFIVFSMPAAFLGAQLEFSQENFFIILGTALLLAALFMIFQSINHKFERKELKLSGRAGLGVGIGFLSGLAGIGGGIFLSPILNVYGWATPRVIASLASVFIWTNSVAGLIGLWRADTLKIDIGFVAPIFIAVALGGVIGSYLSNSKINLNWIRIFTALLVSYVGARIILLNGFGIKI